MKTKQLTLTAMMSAFVFIATFVPKIPISLGYAHLGFDSKSDISKRCSGFGIYFCRCGTLRQFERRFRLNSRSFTKISRKYPCYTYF